MTPHMRRAMLLFPVLLLGLAGVRASCLPNVPPSGALAMQHFVAPAAPLPGAVGFSLATLQDGEAPELIAGGYQFADGDPGYRPSFGVLFARESIGGSAYRIRAALPFDREFFVYVAPIDGTLFGVDPHAVIAITRPRDYDETHVSLIDGAAWSVLGRCSLPVAAAASTIAPDRNGGPSRLYVQDASAIHVYSLPDLDEVRTLTDAGGTGFAIAQLDGDDAEEIVLAGTPGRVIDAISGATEWSYAGGFGDKVVAGRFDIGGHDGFLARDWLGVHVFSGAPWSLLWTIPQKEFPSYAQQMVAADVDNDDRDEIAVAQWYLQGAQSVQSVRIFDASTQALVHEDAEPPFPDIVSLAMLRNDAGTTQVVESLDYMPDLRVHAYGAPDAAWTDTGESGPFAFAEGAFGSGVRPSLVYGGRTGQFRAPLLHVIDREQWIQTGESPPNGDPAAIPIWETLDLATVHANTEPVDRLAIGGKKWWGSVATVQPAIGWTLDWQIGDEQSSNDAPLGMRTVERLAAYDVNGDGVDDALVGAGEYGGSEYGIMVAAFDGTDGAMLWESPALGGLYPHVADLEIARRSSGDLLLVAGSEALRAFNPVTGALLHTVAGATSAVTATSEGLIVAGSPDGTIRAFNPSWKLVWKRKVPAFVSAIAQPAPGLPILVVAASHIRWLDANSDQLALLSAPSGLAAANRWSLTYDDATRIVHVVAASNAGLYELTLAAPREDGIFNDGLD
jgi:hypothetical protein